MALTTVYSSFASSAHRKSFVVFKRKLYVFNGWDRPRVYDGIGTSDYEAGIDGGSTSWSPSEADVAGSNTAGNSVLCRYRFKDSTTGYVSDPSSAYTATIGASGGFRFSITAPSGGGDIETSTDSKVDTIVLECTTVNQGLFYVAAEVPNAAGNVDHTLSDTALAEAGFLYPDGFAANGKPPFFRAGLVHKNRIIGFGAVEHSDGTAYVANGATTVNGTSTNWTEAVVGRYLRFDGETSIYEITGYTSATQITIGKTFAEATVNSPGDSYTIFDPSNKVYFSQAAYPESWAALDYFVGLEEEEVRAVARFGSGLIVFGHRTANRLVWTDSPADGYLRPMLGQRGALHERVIVHDGSMLYVMDRSGIYQFNGEAPQHISAPVDPDITENVAWAYLEKFHAVYYPDLRVIRWFVVIGSETEPTYYYEFDLDMRLWSTGRLDVPITAAATVPRSTGLDVMVCDENGYTWWDNEGVTMGLDTESQGTVTVASGATTTVIPIDETIDASGRGVAGCSFVSQDGTKVGRVSSNTASEITLASALSAAPADGDVYYLGRVQSKLKSKVFRFGRSFNEKSTPLWLVLYLEPQTNAGEVLVRAYKDFSSTAATWPGAKWAAGRLSDEGVTVPADGETDWTVDLTACDSVVRIPLGQDSVRALQVELEVRKPGTRLRLYGYELEFGDTRQVEAS